MKVMNYGETQKVRAIIMGLGAPTRLERSSSFSGHEEAQGGEKMRHFFDKF